MSFDGVDDYINCGTGIDLSNKSFSLSASVRKGLPDFTGAGIVMSTGDGTQNNGLYFGFDTHGSSDDYLFFNFYQPAGELYSEAPVTIENDNEWHHIVATYNFNSHERQIFLDGTLVGSDISSSPFLSSETEFSIGITSWNLIDDFNGDIKNAIVWDRVLSNNEIQQYMNCSPSGNEQGLVGYWDFNEGSGDTVYDISGNGNDGTIYGATYSEDVPENNCENELSPINYTLNPGWNMFAYTGSSPQDAALALEEIIEDVFIVKTLTGNAYWVEWDFNGIGDLNPGEGYVIKIINNQHTIQFSNNFEIGVELQLETGWNYVGYTGAYMIPLQIALADYDLENTFSEIKDIKGNFWNSTMGSNSSLKYLIPGEAYYMYVIENPPLIDFTNQQVNVGAESSNEVSLFDYSASSMTITFPAGSFPNELIGSKVKASFDFDGDGDLDEVSKEYVISNESSLGMVINGDDSSTYPELDGMSRNNTPVFTIEYNDVQLILDLEYDILFTDNGRVIYDGAINFRSESEYCFDPLDSYYDSVQHYFSFLEAYNYYGCVDANYVEFNETASCSDASCITYITYGCTNVAADNYSGVATVEDNTCIFLGCMDNHADNYSSQANSEDGSCIYSGCMDEMACNFIAQASVNLPVCTYPENYRLCSGLCNNDVDNDGICDEEEITGCTNPGYINFNPSATDDDGTCSDSWQSAFFNAVNGQVSIDIVEGWNLIGYTGVNPLNIEDGVMSIVDIIVIMKNNDGDVYWPEYGFNGIGNLYPGQGYQIKALNSYENFIYSNDNSLAGCTDEDACNFNVEALYFDNSCEYSESCSDCEGNPTPCLIGQSLNGGLVFVLDDTGEHGLIVAPSDIGYYSWGCDTLYVEANSYDGMENSTIIQSDCNDQLNAAIACLTYEYNGYNDWYLPSADELSILFNSIGPTSLVGNVANLTDNEIYLSSNQEYTGGVLGCFNFVDDFMIEVVPSINPYLVRPIRKF